MRYFLHRMFQRIVSTKPLDGAVRKPQAAVFSHTKRIAKSASSFTNQQKVNMHFMHGAVVVNDLEVLTV